MLKIYFDWNAMAGFRSPVSEPYLTLLHNINMQRDKYLIVYSPAHLNDLKRGWDDSIQKDTLTRNDLRFIGEFTKNNLFALFWKEKDVKHKTKSPEEFFDEVKDDDVKPLEDVVNFDKLFADLYFDEEARRKFEEILAPLKARHFDAIYPDIEKDYPEFALVANYLPKPGQSMQDYLIQFAAQLQKMMSDPAVYKAQRDAVQKGLGLDPNEISNLENVYGGLDERLVATPLNNTVSGYVESSITKGVSANLLHGKFMPMYTSLDMFGYRPEALSKKNTFENMATDADHAFYGAHCDFFISNDAKTLAKSKAVYKHFQIGTIVATPSEFLDFLSAR